MSFGQTFLERVPTASEEAIDHMEQLLRNKFDLKTGFAEPRQLARTMHQALLSLDATSDSALNLTRFRQLMRKLNCVESENVVDGLFTRYDTQGKGTVDMKFFADALFGLQKVPRASPEARDVLDRVRSALKGRGENSFRGLSRGLRLADTNGSGQLDLEEFAGLLARNNLTLSADERKKIFFFFDKNGDGQIDITEFMVALRPSMSPARLALVKLAFLRLDKNEDGQITYDELRRLYRTDKHPAVLKGQSSPDDVLRQFSAAWNKNGDEIVSEAEFIDYYADLSAAIDNDAFFELMLRNAWRIAGGTGAAANTANLRVCVTHLDGTQTVETVDEDLGLTKRDPPGIIAALRKQGVTDILRIDF